MFPAIFAYPAAQPLPGAFHALLSTMMLREKEGRESTAGRERERENLSLRL